MKPDYSLLKKVLELPTAPFHEEEVMRFVFSFCRGLKLRVHQDRFGNLKVVYRKGSRGTSPKPIAFLAHMDHPGFEVVRGGKNPVVRLLGGVPDDYFSKAKVILKDGDKSFRGRVKKSSNKKRREFVVPLKEAVSKKAFGYFDLAGFQKQNGWIKTKAADNVINVATLLNLLKILSQKKITAHVICIFSRAEEVGFIGASGFLKNEFLSKNTPVVVLEASSVKGGPITMGKGPVLRVGDRLTTFLNEVTLDLQRTAHQLGKKNRRFLFQRALLSGGTCEASLLTLKGYKAGCLALPLGNYHNRGEKNYALEYVHQKDYENMLVLLEALSRSGISQAAIKTALQKIDKNFKKFSRRLKGLKRITD